MLLFYPMMIMTPIATDVRLNLSSVHFTEREYFSSALWRRIIISLETEKAGGTF